MTAGADIDSTLDWWREAGVDTIVGDEPGRWLAEKPAATATKPRSKSEIAEQAPPARPTPPDDLGAFARWFAETDLVAGPGGRAFAPTGSQGSELMIVVDMPEPEDERSGQLLSGEAGLLFDRMLAAIGLDRRSIYLASLSPARVLGGAIAETEQERLAEIARHHARLAAPKRLLTMGEAPTRAFCGTGLNEARTDLHTFDGESGTIRLVATFHPRFLLKQPRFKAESWRDLQMLMGETA